MKWQVLFSRPLGYFLLAAAVLAIILPLVFITRSSRSEVRYRTRFAVPWFQSSALVYIAEKNGYFRDEDLAVTYQYRATGKECLDLLLNGEADFAVAFETPIMHAIMKGRRVSILTELHRSEQNTGIVSRKQSGIATAKDLIGKKVAVVPKTNAEFLLNFFLRSQLIDPSSVHFLPMPVGEAVESFIGGKVDAVALWEPYVSQSTASAPAEFKVLHSSHYSEFSMLASLRENLDVQDDVVYGILRALKRAADYFAMENKRARASVDRELRDQHAYVSPTAWDRMDIHIGLSATLLKLLSEEAEWFSSQSRSRETFDHDMRSNLRGRYLKTIAPETVTYE